MKYSFQSACITKKNWHCITKHYKKNSKILEYCPGHRGMLSRQSTKQKFGSEAKNINLFDL